jgi:hypothetical protein
MKRGNRTSGYQMSLNIGLFKVFSYFFEAALKILLDLDGTDQILV